MDNYKITENESKRINICRLICIILVLFIHVRNVNYATIQTNLIGLRNVLNYIQYYISEIIARGAVPLFFLLSSILLYKNDFKWLDNFKKKLKRIIIPFIFWNTLWIILFYIFQKVPYVSKVFSNEDNNVSKFNLLKFIDAYLAIFERSKPFLYPLWFLKDLFVLNVFSKIIKKIMDKIPYIFLMITFILMCTNINIRIIEIQSLFFFSLGYFCVKNNIKISCFDKINTKRTIIMYTAMTALYCLIEIKYKELLIVKNIINIFTIMIILIISKHLLFMYNNRYLKYAINNTFFIYLFHEWNLYFLRKVIDTVSCHNIIITFLSYFFIPFVIIVMALSISYIWKKINYKSYKLVTGER